MQVDVTPSGSINGARDICLAVVDDRRFSLPAVAARTDSRGSAQPSRDFSSERPCQEIAVESNMTHGNQCACVQEQSRLKEAFAWYHLVRAKSAVASLFQGIGPTPSPTSALLWVLRLENKSRRSPLWTRAYEEQATGAADCTRDVNKDGDG
jgi:hypothetical protein